MAASASATAILVLFHGPVITTNVVTFAPEVSLMAGRTKGCVPGCGVGKWRSDDIAVTGATCQLFPVITGVISSGVMVEVGGCPGLCCMTLVALQVG